ncbi:hypothetical protein [Treponema bryantii]|uniref:hypothetical protein n=1 Tax=Treponema bryantii TaxID=163 RepID=UPI002B30CBB2|nr:hypothetical protein TRBR_10390 [Treponema bryantii]
MDSVYQTIKTILTSNTLPTYDEFFDLLNQASDCLEKEKTQYRQKASDDSTGGLVDFHEDELPLIVIPDLHARPYFLMNILDYQLYEDMTVFEALSARRVRLLSVGDILHTERHTRERWAAAAAEFDNGIFTGPALSAEMQEGLCLLAGLLKLKEAFPAYVHILKGNHENILNATGDGDYAFRKFADEGEMGMVFVQDFYGDDILYLMNCVEKSLPLVYFGKKCVVSHAEPFRTYTREELVNARLTKGVVEGLTWTDNGTAAIGSAQGTIKNLCEGFELSQINDYVYLGGHRPVTGNYKLLQNGRYIQFHNPGKQNIALVQSDRKFNPETDIVEIKK